MPASHTVTPAAFSFSTIAVRFFSVTAGSVPRSASLPPSSTSTMSGLSASIQSIRSSPPAVVSPETP